VVLSVQFVAASPARGRATRASGFSRAGAVAG
jgi:hypothetical protein